MSDRYFGSHIEGIEERLRDTAPAFPYPPTPDVAGEVRRRLAGGDNSSRRSAQRTRFVWGLAAVLALMMLVALLAVPQVQALVRSLFRIGVIEVVVATPSPTSVSSTPGSDVTPQAPIDLAGETTLPAAREQVPFTINLPIYPTDLGEPDRVFVQELNGPALILVWTEPGQRDQPRLVLYELSSAVPGEQVIKGVKSANALQETTVNGRPAVWITGPHWLQFFNRLGLLRADTRYLLEGNVLDGNVLLWDTGGTTYRLETTLSLEDATRVAESLAP